MSLSENKDYVFTKCRENSQTGGRPKNVYMLTPECFKTILIAATKHSSHTIDVLKYKKYYIFLEKVVGYYMSYQHLLDEAEKKFKDGTIEDLRTDIDELKQMTKSQSTNIDELTRMNKELMGHTIDIKSSAKRTEAYARQTYQSMNAFLGLFVETGTSNSLFKTLLASHESID